MKNIKDHFVRKVISRVGIFVSNQSVEMVEIEPSESGAFRVTASLEADLDGGIFEKGMIVDPERLSGVIKTLANGTTKFSTPEVYAALPDESTYFHIFTFPGDLTNGEVKNAIRFQFEEVFPLVYANAVVDFVVVARSVEETLVACAAVSKEVTTQFETVLKGAGLKPFGFTLEAEALRRSLLDEAKPTQATLLVYIKKDQCVLCAFDSYGLYGSFTAKIGETDQSTGASRIKFLMNKIQKIASWYENKTKDNLNELVLFGDLPHMATIEEELKKHLKEYLPHMNVRMSDFGEHRGHLASAKISEKEKNQNVHAVAYGAALLGFAQNTRPLELLASAQKSQPATSQNVSASDHKNPFHFENVKMYISTVSERTKIICSAIFILLTVIGLVVSMILYKRASNKAEKESIELRASLLKAVSTPAPTKK